MWSGFYVGCVYPIKLPSWPIWENLGLVFIKKFDVKRFYHETFFNIVWIVQQKELLSYVLFVLRSFLIRLAPCLFDYDWLESCYYSKILSQNDVRDSLSEKRIRFIGYIAILFYL